MCQECWAIGESNFLIFLKLKPERGCEVGLGAWGLVLGYGVWGLGFRV